MNQGLVYIQVLKLYKCQAKLRLHVVITSVSRTEQSLILADDPARNTEFNYKDMKRRDRRRWEAADLDKDDRLTKDELTSFLHPEEVEHMKSIMVEETMEDIDKDKDGKISLDEYIGESSLCRVRNC